jgi:hypothetical protein
MVDARIEHVTGIKLKPIAQHENTDDAGAVERSTYSRDLVIQTSSGSISVRLEADEQEALVASLEPQPKPDTADWLTPRVHEPQPGDHAEDDPVDLPRYEVMVRGNKSVAVLAQDEKEARSIAERSLQESGELSNVEVVQVVPIKPER